jgi:hypothetical protein
VLPGQGGRDVHNGRVSQRSLPLTRRATVRAAALVIVAGLAVAGCSSQKPGAEGSASPSPSGSPSPSTTVSVPPSQQLTEQGMNLPFGNSATVVFEATKHAGTVLKLTVKSAQQGSLNDFRAFTLDDPYKRNAHYYYVKVSVENVGEGDVGGVPVPLWGVNGDNTLLPAVNFTTDFPKCPSQPLPAKFGPGAKLDTCLVYLSPNKGTLDAVSYRPSQEFNPITWTGQVQSPAASPTKKPTAKKSKKQ